MQCSLWLDSGHTFWQEKTQKWGWGLWASHQGFMMSTLHIIVMKILIIWSGGFLYHKITIVAFILDKYFVGRSSEIMPMSCPLPYLPTSLNIRESLPELLVTMIMVKKWFSYFIISSVFSLYSNIRVFPLPHLLVYSLLMDSSFPISFSGL